MQKLLIVLNGFYAGGFSSSLLNFLHCAQSRTDIEITLLLLQKEKTALEEQVPHTVRILRLQEQTFKKWHPSNLRRFFHHYKYVAKELFCRYVKHCAVSTKALREYAQIQLCNKAKRMTNDFSFAKEFDAVISWEEDFCNYVLVDQIPAKYKIGLIHPNYRTALFSKAADTYYIRKLDRIVTISDACCQTLREEFPFAKDKIVYVPNRLHYGNLVAKANAFEPAWDNTRPTLVTVARMIDRDKAIFRIVDLCVKLKQNGVSFTWYLIGDGPDFIPLKERIAACQIGDRLICLGEMPNPLPYTKGADLFVMQSHREGRPVAVDEALLLGTPALITNYSSAHEQIDDGKTGWIVNDTFDAIYEKLDDLLRNPAVLKDAAAQVALLDRHAYEDCSALLSLIPKQ